MSYDEAVAYLLSILGEIRTENFGLDRMRRLMAALGEPQRSFRAVHLAGTNGKGSTAAMIDSGLRAAGFSTGLYTSPHLVRFNERMRIRGDDIGDEAFAEAVECVRGANERLLAEEEPGVHATFFETVTAAAFEAFRRAGVEWGVVETGLGGRLDATNVLEPRLVVLTPVGLDHESFLGKRPEMIAEEKAGVLKPGAALILAPQRAEIAELLRRRAAALGVDVIEAGADWRAEQLRPERGCYRFVARSGAGASLDIELPVAGEHQVENALAAVAALDALGAPRWAIEEGVRRTRWPGRLQRLPGEPEILLDAAHNPAGARSLARFLDEHEHGRRIHLVFAASRDKALEEVAGALFPLAERVILTRSSVARSIGPGNLRRIVDHLHERIEVRSHVAEALQAARSGAGPRDLIVVAGSIFLVGEVLAGADPLYGESVDRSREHVRPGQ